MNAFGELMSKRVWMIAAIAALVACGTDEVVSTSPRFGASPARPQSELFGESVMAPGRVVACTQREAAADSALIGPAGGTLRVGNNELVVPPGALAEPVIVRGEIPADTIASIRLLPEGLVFRKAAGLVLDTTGCADPGDAAKILYLDDAGTVLEEIEAFYSPWWKRVAAPISHFSRYALGV
jgi:hypothetical protein